MKPNSPAKSSAEPNRQPSRADGWGGFCVNKSLPTPIYHQIFAFLRDRILDGTFSPNNSFPSESQLVTSLKVSRITARRALEELAARGLIVRQQGKPSIVAPYRPHTQLIAGVEGMIENNRRMGDLTTVELLAHEMVPASAEVASKLQVKHKTPVLWSVRIRRLNDVPFSYAVTYLPGFVKRRLHTEEMSSRPLIELLELAGIEIGHAEQRISAIAATAEVARALHIERGDALLLSERVVYDLSDRPVELIAVQYRPDIYEYSVELSRTPSSDGKVWATRAV